MKYELHDERGAVLAVINARSARAAVRRLVTETGIAADRVKHVRLVAGQPGRPPLGDETGFRVNVYLDAETVERAREIGGGNLSAGVKEAVRRFKAWPA